MRPHIYSIGLFVCILGLSGCCPTIPIVRPVPLCVPEDKIALENCEAALALQEGKTYGDALSIAITNEARLTSCIAKQRTLVKALTLCNDEYRELNIKIDGINEKIKANSSK